MPRSWNNRRNIQSSDAKLTIKEVIKMNIYSKESIEEALENDEIEGTDEAFMQGFFQAS